VLRQELLDDGLPDFRSRESRDETIAAKLFDPKSSWWHKSDAYDLLTLLKEAEQQQTHCVPHHNARLQAPSSMDPRQLQQQPQQCLVQHSASSDNCLPPVQRESNHKLKEALIAGSTLPVPSKTASPGEICHLLVMRMMNGLYRPYWQIA
jgi:hypothetical protein